MNASSRYTYMYVVFIMLISRIEIANYILKLLRIGEYICMYLIDLERNNMLSFQMFSPKHVKIDRTL